VKNNLLGESMNLYKSFFITLVLTSIVSLIQGTSTQQTPEGDINPRTSLTFTPEQKQKLQQPSQPIVHEIMVTNCSTPGELCSPVMNAVGDRANIDINNLSLNDLGTIRTTQTKQITLPSKSAKQTAYSFTPTSGESANKKIYVVFDNVAQPVGTRFAGKTVIKIYRKLQGQEKS
jgi:hypothetical protein